MMEKVFISVILPLKLEWEPCYFMFKDFADLTKIGDRVRVNFAGRTYVGVVSAIDIEPSADVSKIKEAFLEKASMASVFSEEIELWKRVADYYMCTVGEVYKAAYPSGKTNLEEALALRRIRELERNQKKIADLELKYAKFSEKLQKISDRIEFKNQQIEKSKKTESRDRYISEKDKIISDKVKLIEQQSDLKQYIFQLKSAVSQKDTPILNICRKGPEINLTSAQQLAYQQILDGFSDKKPVLLHGVTGSGKTEIYLKLAEKCISTGRNVLYLVPEIALSRQLEGRLREHFHSDLYIYHSGQSAVQKRDVADIIRNRANDSTESTDIPQNSYIVLGTRSALFLPHNNLGLIIVDEEHDSSYKQESPAPRYNGRDTALMLAQIQTDFAKCKSENEACNIILGSATPSLEEVYNCATGRHMLVRLAERFHGADDSDVEIIDTKAERRKKGMVGSFSKKLIFKINSVLAAGGQVMILRSRRAWSTAMQCSECGDIVKCPHCNVSLSLHGRPENGRFVCHYCGYSKIYEDKCPKCGNGLVPLGTGTQRIEEEVVRMFPDARVARLDSDSAKNKGYEVQIIQDFSDGKIDILVGTQIVAKGFDFSNLRLVAVIAADALMGLQDFRADEKAMQLLEQFRGRCGRREQKGLFVIQTSQPEHPIYQRIIHREADCFTRTLMAERKEFGFPPYSRIVEIQIKDRVEHKAFEVASKLSSMLRAQLDPIYGYSLSVVTGPYTPIPDKVADYFLRMVRISLRKDRHLTKSKMVIRDIVRDLERQCDSLITINVDPS